MRIVSLFAVVLLIGGALAQQNSGFSKAPQDVTLQDLEFISGHSRGEFDGGIADEHWSEPAGDSLMGVYRYMKNGRVQMYQVMVIEQAAKGPVLRLMHFNPGLGPWEDKAQVLSYPLIRYSPGEVVFERPDKSTRISYRVAGNGVLESTLERAGKKTEVFQYKHSAE